MYFNMLFYHFPLKKKQELFLIFALCHWPDKLARKVQSNMDVTNQDLLSLVSVILQLIIRSPP